MPWGGVAVTNESRRVLLEASESRRYRLPSLLTMDKVAFIFLISAGLALVILVTVPAASFQHFRFVLVFVFASVLVFAVPMTLMRRWLNRQPIWLATIVVALTALGVLLAMHTSVIGLVPEELKQNISLSRQIVFTAAMVGSFLRYNYIRQSLHRREESELHARIQALQSRIRPHFLFNSMNIIASLIPVDPDAAETVVEDLSELFRASLQQEGSEVSIGEELALCRRYMRIEQLRLGERLNIEWRVEEIDEPVRIPLLTLQPLLENAIYHGIQPLPEGGTITVSIGYASDSYQITVINPLPSEDLSQPVSNKYPTTQGRGNQLAIQNIRSRLDVLYGQRAYLETQTSGEVFVTRVKLPKTLTAR